MNERDELIRAARRGLMATLSQALLLRSEFVRAVDAAETAMGHENKLLGSAMQDIDCFVRCVRWAARDVQTKEEASAERVDSMGGQP